MGIYKCKCKTVSVKFVHVFSLLCRRKIKFFAMAFTKLSFVALMVFGIVTQVAISNAIHTYPYDPSLSLRQAEALQDAATINQAAAINHAAALNQGLSIDNPLYNYKDILSYPPYSLYCDCDYSLYLNPTLANELIQIADQYNQRVCDLLQWYLISETVMPTLPDQPWRLNMIESLSRAMYDEQARCQLAYLPEYPTFCNSIYPDALPLLTKRSPDLYDLPPTVTPYTTNSPLAYYYNLMFLMEKTLPSLSPQLQQDIKDAVYTNTQIPQLGQAPELIRRLNSNFRVNKSEMYDFTPSFY